MGSLNTYVSRRRVPSHAHIDRIVNVNEFQTDRIRLYGVVTLEGQQYHREFFGSCRRCRSNGDSQVWAAIQITK
jgi:hypothetical protein